MPPQKEDCELGLSDVVSTDVQDAVYAVCAEMFPTFAGQSPVEFQASNEMDETRADQETRAVNKTANKAGVYMATAAAVQDAMLRRAGVVKVSWEERIEVRYDSSDGVPLDMLPQMLQPGENEEIDLVEGDIDEMQGMASGVMRRRKTTSRPIIDAVPLDEFLISANVASPNVEEARFLAHQRPVSRSDLIELGLDPEVVLDLSPLTTSTMRSLRRARTMRDQQLRSSHESTDYIMAVEAYYKIDWDGDGIAERRRVITAGGAEGTEQLLLNEPWADQPFAVGIGYLGLYTWDGVSLYDRLKMVQDVKTSLIRDIRDTIRRNMRQRAGLVEGDANLNDWFDSKLGGGIRMKTPNGIVPIPEVQLPPTAFSLLEYLDTMRKDKGGGAIDATASAQVLGQGGDWSLERLMAATEQLNAMVAKNLIETLIKPIYRKLHRLLREHHPQPIDLPGTAGWQQTNPADWGDRDEMEPTMGMSVGERTQRIGALQAVLQHHAEDAQLGRTGMLTDPNGLYQARLDMARLAGLPSPEAYYVDPKSQQSQQAQQQAAQQAQQQAAQAQQEKQQMMQFQYSMMTDIEKVKAEAKLQAQQMAEQSKAMQKQMEMMEKFFGHRKDLAIAQKDWDEAEAQRDVDVLQAEADRRVQLASVTSKNKAQQ